MRKLFLFGAMLVMALFANAQVEDLTSDEKGYPVIAVRDGKIGWVSSEDETKVLIPFEYDGVFDVSYGHECVTFVYVELYTPNNNNENGPIGEVAGPPYWVLKNGKYGLIDSVGNVILPFEYNITGIGVGGLGDSDDNETDPFIHDLIWERNGKMGVFSWGTKVPFIPLIYDDIFVDDIGGIRVFMVKSKGKYGVCLGSGQIVPCIYDLVKGVAGIISYDSRCGFSYTEDFGVRYVASKNGKYGLLNHEGKVIRNCEYDSIDVFYSNENEEQAFAEGDEQTVDEGYEKESSEIEAFFKVRKNGKWGVIDYNGEQILPFEYDDILMPDDDSNCFMVTKSGKTSKINKSGKPCK